ncbi:MAG: T9SS type A sorting domain-containing protein, partial [Bacteroidetes bacterium]|nr:T9SS type A sorting domain-containing protein [Bacteroidota bacterium]
YKYRITITTYTKYIIGASNTDRCDLVVYFGDGDSATAPRVNGPSADCPTADGQMIASTTRKNIYQADHVYPGNGSYLIFFKDPNRNSGICNIPSSGSTTFYLQAELIISSFLGNNTGCGYNEVPVIYDTVGVIAYYDPLVTDSDGDSLFYELIQPFYAPGYTYPSANISFTINANTGTVTWDTPVMICNYVFDIRISEWRNLAGNYYYIGSTMQEIYAQVTPYTEINDAEIQHISVTASPNPAVDIIQFSVSGIQENHAYSLRVINSIGQIMGDFDPFQPLSVAHLNPGMYFYDLKSVGQSIKQGRFVVLAGLIK